MDKIIIWTQEGCHLCENVKRHFQGHAYEERQASELLSGQDKDHAAMVQLAMQDMQLPLVSINGCFVSPFTLLENAA